MRPKGKGGIVMNSEDVHNIKRKERKRIVELIESIGSVEHEHYPDNTSDACEDPNNSELSYNPSECSMCGDINDEMDDHFEKEHKGFLWLKKDILKKIGEMK